jgi:SAM-dependent methyltransferase
VDPLDATRRAWDELQRLRLEVTREPPGLPEPIRALLPDLKDKHVLHEMCGTGEVSADLAALGALVTAIDVWEPPLAAARQRFPNVSFLQADPHELPIALRRRRFHLVLAGGLLPFLHDLGAWAAEAAAALREGGTLLVYDLHPAAACVDPVSLRWREDYFGGALVVGSRLRPARAVRLWRLGEVVSAVAAAGLGVRRLEELRSLSPVRRHDPRVPAAFVLLADKLRSPA